MIQGCDMSHWQGTDIDWDKMVSAGIKFVYLKASQGINYKDDCFEVNAAAAQAHGILVGAYHFTTTEKAAPQHRWFIDCIDGVKLDLPPALDIETYKDATGTKLVSGPIAQEFLKLLRGYQGWKFPVVYTNASSGNRVFPYPKYASVAEYLLWVANWQVSAPTLPDVWAKAEKPWYIWQDAVIGGAPYGVGGQLDHDIWGQAMAFPEPVQPTSPDQITGSVSITIAGNIYTAYDVTFRKVVL